ncbi:MAG: hypothetical protein ACR2KZ_18760, partial [Segetibacter sp.]
MAEVKIEKKKSNWLWVLIGLLFVAGIIYLYFSLTNVSNENVLEKNNSSAVITQIEDAGAVEGFISYVNEDTNKMSLDHTFTNTALL